MADQTNQAALLEEILNHTLDQVTCKYPNLDPMEASQLEYGQLYLLLLTKIKKIHKIKFQIERFKTENSHPNRSTLLNAQSQPESERSTINRQKRNRRLANQIQRHYYCKVPNCDKKFGSEGSLNQHIRNKHPPPNPQN